MKRTADDILKLNFPPTEECMQCNETPPALEQLLEDPIALAVADSMLGPAQTPIVSELYLRVALRAL